MRRTIVCVVGTRPNFVKMVPVVRAMRRREGEFRHVVIHTGQHYDLPMADVFNELAGGPPDHLLGVGPGSHAATTARVMARLEVLLDSLNPDLVLVPGDVNSTLAAALSASKLGIPVGHIEAGLRSFDRTMPEETNRLLTDQISDLLFIHSSDALENLLAEGRRKEDIFQVGNTMIDTLVAMRELIRRADAPPRYGLEPGEYLLVTLHRPALVDGPLLGAALANLSSLAQSGLPVLFPLHPRTRRRIELEGLTAPGVRFTEPLGYVDFVGLMEQAAGVLTDSGGIQEETTFLGVPCFTLRDNTERPVTVQVGTNRLLGLDPVRILEIPGLLAHRNSAPACIPGWDGHAAERLADTLAGLEQFASWPERAAAASISNHGAAAAAQR